MKKCDDTSQSIVKEDDKNGNVTDFQYYLWCKWQLYLWNDRVREVHVSEVQVRVGRVRVGRVRVGYVQEGLGWEVRLQEYQVQEGRVRHVKGDGFRKFEVLKGQFWEN